MKKDTGGPAFPEQSGYIFKSINKEKEIHTEQSESIIKPGMTLRDYFATKAMQSIIAYTKINNEPGLTYEKVSDGSYKFADAMLKERAK
jgi:hypothetical protein